MSLLEVGTTNVNIMKHIYLINAYTCAGRFGIGTYIEQVVECLKNNDQFRLFIVNLNSEGRELEYVKGNFGVDYIEIPSLGYSGRKKDEERYFKGVYYAILPYIDSSVLNIFHLNYIFHIHLVKLLKSQFVNSHIIVTIHYFNWGLELRGNLMHFHSLIRKESELRSPKEQALYNEFIKEKSLLHEVDKIICLSNSTFKILQNDYELSEDKIELIFNGLKQEPVILKYADRQKQKIALHFGESEIVILFVGRLDVAKGITFLIEAFCQVLKKIPEARLLIVGNGDYDVCMKNCTDIWNKVTFTGKIERNMLRKLYQIADIGVLPSFSEQCSYVAIEMMMHGIPLVGTNALGVSEMIEKEFQVSLNVRGDELSFCRDSLAETIFKAITDKEKLSSQYRLRFEKYYSLDIMQSRMEQLYNKL